MNELKQESCYSLTSNSTLFREYTLLLVLSLCPRLSSSKVALCITCIPHANLSWWHGHQRCLVSAGVTIPGAGVGNKKVEVVPGAGVGAGVGTVVEVIRGAAVGVVQIILGDGVGTVVDVAPGAKVGAGATTTVLPLMLLFAFPLPFPLLLLISFPLPFPLLSLISFPLLFPLPPLSPLLELGKGSTWRISPSGVVTFQSIKSEGLGSIWICVFDIKPSGSVLRPFNTSEKDRHP